MSLENLFSRRCLAALLAASAFAASPIVLAANDAAGTPTGPVAETPQDTPAPSPHASDRAAGTEPVSGVAGTEEGILMVEAGALEVSEKVVNEAIQFAHDNIRKIIAVIKKMAVDMKIVKRTVEKPKVDEAL